MRWRNRGWQLIVTIGLMISLLLLGVTATSALEPQYQIANRASFNQIEHYPLTQTLPASQYRPTGNWVGRLILPSVAELGDRDWVWLEVQHAPTDAADFIGQKVKLEWVSTSAVQQYVTAVSRDVKFAATIAASQSKGNLHPDRLNGRSAVGPLQSLAGAHPIDDVWVTIDTANVMRQGNDRRLQIDRDPTIETGRFYALVKLLTTVPNPAFTPHDCPGAAPCPSELFQVQHYNAVSRQFDGPTETIRIPQQPRDWIGVFNSTPRDLARSPAGTAGWYIYGAQDQTGIFTVQALKPRALFQLQPQRTITDRSKSLDYINFTHWQDTEQKRGTLETVLLNPGNRSIDWQVGDRAVVMHLFGGRGGKSGEAPIVGTVTGHFSYGLATIIQEPIAHELQWDLRYQQVYATNVEGVIAGTNSWTAYMGDLRRGWLGTRPIADILVKLDVIEDYDFGGERIAPLAEFQRQLQVINARYRTGDGSGAAVVTPATSCVQDSNQALFATVQQVRHRVATNPQIQQWLKAHPQDPTTERYRRLVQLGDQVEKQLMPLGIVREDWRSNSEALSGTEISDRTFQRTKAGGPTNLLAALTSWRTILPRQTQDELSQLFLQQGATLWVLQTNQVGGDNPDIFPIAPTKAFGRWAIPGTPIALVAIILTRLLGAINLPSVTDWAIGIGALLLYGAVAVPWGLRQGFLRQQVWALDPIADWQVGLKLFLLPSLVEELVFRVLLLPARQATSWGVWVIWAIGGVGLFVLYHPLNAMTFYPAGNPTFFDRRFLVLAGLLGVTCTVIYAATSSLLLIAMIHWIVVLVWLRQLGGWARLGVKSS
jgi:predicted Abi (CAAX) family protease